MLFWMNTSRAQTYEVGPYLGGSNYIGDVGATSYINPKNIAFGGIFKWNRSKRHSFRLSVIHTSLEADDANSSESRRKQRGYSFSNGLTEASLGLEYTFWEWDLHTHKPQITPYLYTGVTGIYTHNFYVNSENNLSKKGDKYGLSLPMVIGVKGTLTRNLILAVEVGARMAFTDNIDGSNPSEFDGGNQYPSFGNENTNDWYMFSGITLTYTFGRKPCYSKF